MTVRVHALVGAALIAAVLWGCGRRGPLELPPKPEPSAAEEAEKAATPAQ